MQINLYHHQSNLEEATFDKGITIASDIRKIMYNSLKVLLKLLCKFIFPSNHNCKHNYTHKKLILSLRFPSNDKDNSDMAL